MASYSNTTITNPEDYPVAKYPGPTRQALRGHAMLPFQTAEYSQDTCRSGECYQLKISGGENYHNHAKRNQTIKVIQKSLSFQYFPLLFKWKLD
jgi:hypothetical protein